MQNKVEKETKGTMGVRIGKKFLDDAEYSTIFLIQKG